MNAKELADEVMSKFGSTFDKDVADHLYEFLLLNGDKLIQWAGTSQSDREKILSDIEEQIKNSPEKLSEEEKEHRRQFLKEIYLEGKSKAEALGIDRQYLEGLYSLGYNFYKNGKYEMAANLFCNLVLLDDKEARYFFAAGATFHRLKDYGSAIGFYNLSTTLDWFNPIPWFHLADCYNRIEHYPNALMSAKNVLNRTKDQSKYFILHQKAEVLYDAIVDRYEQFLKKWENAPEKPWEKHLQSQEEKL